MTEVNTWKDKVAIVTGGSSGIGRATALALADAGARVFVTGRDAARLSQAAADHDAITLIQADSADAGAAARIVKVVLDTCGRIDLVVNNTGAGHPMPMEAYNVDAMQAMSAVNIIAPSLLVGQARAALCESKGAIVNIGTAVSRNAVPMMAHYAATKAALEHLTRSWAMEFAEAGVRVNAIAPGPVKTGALTGMMGLPDEMAAHIEQQEAEQIPLGRRGITSDIVPWVLRLGAGDNEWLTGQVLTIDGGWSLRS